jgi:uncharacterized protein with GYD domain
MALYVHLVKTTHQGASKIREMSSTYETVRRFGESLGCKVVACFGEYDFVGLWDGPQRNRRIEVGRVCRVKRHSPDSDIVGLQD